MRLDRCYFKVKILISEFVLKTKYGTKIRRPLNINDRSFEGTKNMIESTTKEKGQEEIPSPENFCLNIPLYKRFPLKRGFNPFDAIECFEGTLDCFCHDCGRNSVFNRIEHPHCEKRAHFINYIFPLWFACSRDENHKAVFVFRAHKGTIQKIGQHPSIADLATPDFQKYRRVLSNERFGEFTRGVGLASHGIGIGAFVYLRRIFESLIEKAQNAAANNSDWDQPSCERARMDEKIKMLKQHLPSFLVTNRALYSIMSCGIHTLSESECLRSFRIVKVGIELILDEQLEKYERDLKIRQTEAHIATLGGALKNKKT